VEKGVGTSTQNQAASALVFYFEAVLGRGLGPVDGILRGRRGKRLPVVLDREEVRAILKNLAMPHRLVATLLYGSGLRLHGSLLLQVVIRKGRAEATG
jgi:integrase